MTISILLALIGLIGYAWRRRDGELVVALALGLGLCASVVAVAATVPTGALGFAAASYVLIWTSAAGMFVWLVFAWSSWVLLVPARLQGAAVHPRLKLTALGIVALVVVAVSVRPAEDPTRLPPGNKDFALIREATERVISAVGRDTDVLVVHVGNPAQTFETSIIYALRRHGVTPAVRRKLPSSLRAREAVLPGFPSLSHRRHRRRTYGTGHPSRPSLDSAPGGHRHDPPRAKIGPGHSCYARSLKDCGAARLAAARMRRRSLMAREPLAVCVGRSLVYRHEHMFASGSSGSAG